MVAENFMERFAVPEDKAIQLFSPIIKDYALAILLKLQREKPHVSSAVHWSEFKAIMDRKG
jgi:hypothetical protein